MGLKAVVAAVENTKVNKGIRQKQCDTLSTRTRVDSDSVSQFSQTRCKKTDGALRSRGDTKRQISRRRSVALGCCFTTHCNYLGGGWGGGHSAELARCLSASPCVTLTRFHTLKLVDARHNPELLLSAAEQPDKQAPVT